MDAIHTEKRHGLNISIYQDENPISPREDASSCFGKMICFHSRYTLGDKHNESPESLLKIIDRKNVLSLELYLYDHGNISLRTYKHGLHSNWDCGKVGYIYVTFEDIKKNFGVKRLSKKILQKAKDILNAEVATFNDYISGNVYGYSIKDDQENDIESVWGFFGDYEDDNGACSEARSVIDRLTNEGKTDSNGQYLMAFLKEIKQHENANSKE